MPAFRSVHPQVHYPIQLQHDQPMLSLGSCFAEAIGTQLERAKFDVVLNPFGILFSPVALGVALQRLVSGEPYREEDLMHHAGYWFSFDHHSRFTSLAPGSTLEAINTALRAGHTQLRRGSRLLLTLGSAHVWEYLPQHRLVANCHKLPGHQFRRQRLNTAAVVAAMAPALALLQDLAIETIISVSPVRYLRAGFRENQLSKASLLLACAELEAAFPTVHYFPAYEILLDDLRDYRFFAPDLVHPSEVGIQYIWEYFASGFFSPTTQAWVEKIHALDLALRHRPLHPESTDHRRFRQQQYATVVALEQALPQLDFSAEKAFFKD